LESIITFSGLENNELKEKIIKNAQNVLMVFAKRAF
jgi:hypothetical protein